MNGQFLSLGIVNGLYPPAGVTIPDINSLQRNFDNINTWATSAQNNLNALNARLEKQEDMIKWIGETYPHAIAGYLAIKDIERSVA